MVFNCYTVKINANSEHRGHLLVHSGDSSFFFSRFQQSQLTYWSAGCFKNKLFRKSQYKKKDFPVIFFSSHPHSYHLHLPATLDRSLSPSALRRRERRQATYTSPPVPVVFDLPCATGAEIARGFHYVNQPGEYEYPNVTNSLVNKTSTHRHPLSIDDILRCNNYRHRTNLSPRILSWSAVNIQ